MGEMEGKVAIVTGAASDIGAATARLLAGRGAHVLAVDLDPRGAEAVAADIRARGHVARAQQADIADENAIRAMVEAAVAAFGGIDLLDNVAAFTSPGQTNSDDAIVNMQASVWDGTFAVNLRGSMLCCKHTIPQMLKRGGGSIVNVSSTAGILTLGTVPAYGASKAGLHSLTQALAVQYGPQNIRCNTIAPGFVVTKKTRLMGEDFFRMTLDSNALPFLGEPEDIAQATAFLLSSAARYITGQLLPVDGGQTIHLPVLADMRRMAGGQPLVKAQ
jgi:NAD(P)-dependent dehydrogenase (short-subunit alcohol dehydrogenase family)